jgi:hypothetical protein
MQMKIKHILVASTILAVAAGSSRADVVASTGAKHAAIAEPERIDSETVPKQCRQFLAVPADSRSELLAWNQRLSLAACEQDTIAPPATSDPAKLPALVTYLDGAVQRPTAIYRDAMAHGPTQTRMRAAYGLGTTSINLMVRARNAIPASPDLDKNLALHRALEPLHAGHGRDAASAFAEVDRLATQFPADASANAVMQSIVASARSQLQAGTEHPSDSRGCTQLDLVEAAADDLWSCATTP